MSIIRASGLKCWWAGMVRLVPLCQPHLSIFPFSLSRTERNAAALANVSTWCVAATAEALGAMPEVF